MTVPSQDNSTNVDVNHDKEINLRKQREYYEKKLHDAALEKGRLGKELEDRKRASAPPQDDEDDDEPYVDKKKLKKELGKFEEQTLQKTQTEVQLAIQKAIEQDREERWLEDHKDFISVMQNATKLHERNPQLARNILSMPDTFARQQLVYNTIKELSLDKDPVKQPSIQDKIDANRRSPFYQPSGTATSPYSPTSDFSEEGQKAAHDHMKALQKRMRLG